MPFANSKGNPGSARILAFLASGTVGWSNSRW